jgi:hypothetical protein
MVDVHDYLKKIDFPVITGISEGQPLAILEAMTAEAAVTTKVGSCEELMRVKETDLAMQDSAFQQCTSRRWQKQ